MHQRNHPRASIILFFKKQEKTPKHCDYSKITIRLHKAKVTLLATERLTLTYKKTTVVRMMYLKTVTSKGGDTTTHTEAQVEPKTLRGKLNSNIDFTK